MECTIVAGAALTIINFNGADLCEGICREEIYFSPRCYSGEKAPQRSVLTLSVFDVSKYVGTRDM